MTQDKVHVFKEKHYQPWTHNYTRTKKNTWYFFKKLNSELSSAHMVSSVDEHNNQHNPFHKSQFLSFVPIVSTVK